MKRDEILEDNLYKQVQTQESKYLSKKKLKENFKELEDFETMKRNNQLMIGEIERLKQIQVDENDLNCSLENKIDKFEQKIRELTDGLYDKDEKISILNTEKVHLENKLEVNKGLIKNLEEKITETINEKLEISKESTLKIQNLENERERILELKFKEKMDFDNKILEINNILNDKEKQIADLLNDNEETSKQIDEFKKENSDLIDEIEKKYSDEIKQVKNENESLKNSHRLKDSELLKEINELNGKNDLEKNLNCVNLKLKQALIEDLKTELGQNDSLLEIQKRQNEELVMELKQKEDEISLLNKRIEQQEITTKEEIQKKHNKIEA
ncbi:unnamed protein product [Brachionus calyciflorus]|uniref:Uncharacterized protein n=1 Tax=Brachionus calyciflorus TaxID=104777 RepID=A0A814C4C6_9BILA|nr:unnamed protein product [Brachionus calyciflorus]